MRELIKEVSSLFLFLRDIWKIMQTQICSNPKCGKEKPLDINHFKFRNDTQKFTGQCRECISAQRKDHYKRNRPRILVEAKIYRDGHKEQIVESSKIYYEANRESILEYHNSIKDKLSEYDKIYREENKEELSGKRKKRQKHKRATQPTVRLKENVSNNIRAALKSNGSSKNGRAVFNYLSYTLAILVAHLEFLFEPWMTWDNYGKYNKKTWIADDPTTWTWQLDHIIPHSTFHYTTMDCQEFRDCWALSNLRPLQSKQNILDGATRIRHKPKTKK
jgi:hypothetical protein